LLGNHVGAEPDGRYVKTELHNKRDDITEITVFDIERGDPQTGPVLAMKAIRMKSGRRLRRQPGQKPNHAISTISIAKLMRKSVNATTTVAIGTINLGKTPC